MKEAYEKSLRKIKELPRILAVAEWNKIAIKEDVLTTESLKYISKKSFIKICREVRAN